MKKIYNVTMETCSFCKKFEPIFDSISKELSSNDLVFEILDVQKDYSTIQKYGVEGVPTIIMVDENGEEIKRNVGYMKEELLKNFVLYDEK